MSWTDDKIKEFLDKTVIPARLAFLAPDGSPAVASHWFLFDKGCIWCAVQKDSFVARCLASDSRCGFEIAGDLPPYRGVRGRGQAHLVPERGETVLRQLMARYLGDRSRQLQRFLLDRVATETAIRIEPEKLSSWDFSDRMD